MIHDRHVFIMIGERGGLLDGAMVWSMWKGYLINIGSARDGWVLAKERYREGWMGCIYYYYLFIVDLFLLL
ncbi:uncharacterized protein BO95DRAFT_257902 [Aspergillus brunneoviolaceus CBS 621.78]|uniref:Uncharacterized protein n=1 Tax=Aspergillus brunneoviolaceus CBS 621.78 TaxID=1450534 RepID=A0ACD1FXR7_9EURO|nr:hypothetical protein BO95DRAFT_257902 [Aspergillus brunneoviolaceus CBS 621.78]RAH41802.1 hypothetical protein BO95DRAFT_257902 [Aspergillus brunneoviolaceus CBS 621.78]